jgi:hypothetical protein
MRRLRSLALSAAVLVGMLGGSSLAVMAQEGPQPVVVTMSIVPGDDVGHTTWDVAEGRVERRGTVRAPTIASTSDPRLDGDMTASIDEDQYAGPDGPESFVLGTSTIRIENPDGAWQGSGVAFSGGGRGGSSTIVLVGEGAFDGLYAVLDVTDWGDVKGVIFPAPPPAVPSAP